MAFRVLADGPEPDRDLEVRRPFALIGRDPECDIRIDLPGVEGRHVYLHLDPHGVYAVDLATRGRTRLAETGRAVGWLTPGESVEVAGRRVVLLGSDGGAADPGPGSDDDLVAESKTASLVGVTLEPRSESAPPWVLGSELVFLGRSPACGIPIRDPAAARVHCAIVLTRSAAYVVNLGGRPTRIDRRDVAVASPLPHGAVLAVGSTEFLVRVSPPQAVASGQWSVASSAVVSGQWSVKTKRIEPL
jgi:pSer/pThr/pTyr-binding forkhead associated (FHA) protein